MSERLEVHPTHPQPRALARAAQALARHGLLLLPTDAGYAFGWALEAQQAEQRVMRLRALDTHHPFTVLCRHLSDVGSLARLDTPAFRLVRSLVPGPYTFVLPVASALPHRLKQAPGSRSRRRAIGCRIPDHAVAQALLEAHGAPLLVSTVALPDDSPEAHDADAVAERLQSHVDVMLDAADCPPGPSSVIDLTGDAPLLLRAGRIVPDL